LLFGNIYKHFICLQTATCFAGFSLLKIPLFNTDQMTVSGFDSLS